MINKVFNGRNCNKKVKFDKLGKVKVKLGGRLLHFICGKDSRLIGDKFSVCIDGEWSHPVPVCACEYFIVWIRLGLFGSLSIIACKRMGAGLCTLEYTHLLDPGLWAWNPSRAMVGKYCRILTGTQ